MEAIAIPVSFAVLVWVFGGLLAAALPVVVGGLAIVGSLAILRLIALVTDVSIFALNLSTALGLALAIDYTLLIVSRYRDEIAGGADREEALIQTMLTAGRTVVFSATTVALSLAAMVLFPMYFLKSFAYAGIATVALCAVAALVVTPAADRGARRPPGRVGRATRHPAAARSRRTAAHAAAAAVLVPMDERGDAARAPDRAGRLGGVDRGRPAIPGDQRGVSPTIACCRGRRRPIRSVTGCARVSPTTPRAR